MTATEPIELAREADRAPDRGPAGTPPRWRQWLASVRLHIVAWHVLVLALALALSIVTVRAVLLVRLDERINRELVQEAEELRTLAGGLDPATGEPFGAAADRLFEVFLLRNVTAPNETLVTYVDGRPFLRSAAEPPARLDLEPALATRWAGASEPLRGTVDHPDVGDVDYLAVPVLYEGEPRGVFVIIYFSALERAEVAEVVMVSSVVGLLALLMAAAITWNVGSRVLSPVRAVTHTAREITESDLTGRIEVTGADEVSMLARTFNSMLDRLQSAFSSQRAFIDDAGHELRTPITIIRGHLELLDHADPQDRAETVALVLDELDRMHRMVEDLLLLAKSERPDFVHLDDVDVATLTDELAAKARALADRTWQLEEVGEGTIRADRQRLTEALVELAKNATRHTTPADVVAIGSSVVDSEARFWVRDTGTGIADADRARLFDRFVRGSYPRGEADGSGLGLAIVKVIAEAHRGRVEVDSVAGQGSVFTVVVPEGDDRAAEGE